MNKGNLLLELFENLVKIPSPSLKEEKVSAWILEYCDKTGINARLDDYSNVFLKIEATDSSKTPILLSSHMDVVGDSSPINLIKEGDFYKTDGKRTLGADDKCGVAIALCLATELVNSEIKHGGLEVVFTRDEESGRQAIDGDTAQVGPQISEHLGLPVISYAQDIKIDGDSVVVERQFEDRYHVLKAKMPCLVTALAELNEPRYMTPGGIFDACEAEITVWGRADLKDVDDANLGLKGSPTKIAKASDKVRKGAGEKVAFDSVDESVDYIMGKLKEKHVI